jgi:hypothetical protein
MNQEKTGGNKAWYEKSLRSTKKNATAAVFVRMHVTKAPLK